MAAVENLCGRVVLLQDGRIRSTGATEGVVQEYRADMSERTSVPLREREDRTGKGTLRFTGLRLLDEDGSPIASLRTGGCARIEVSFERSECSRNRTGLVISLGVQTHLSQSLLLFRNDYTGDELTSTPGIRSVICEIPRFPLPPGKYLIAVYAEERGEILDWVRSAADLEVAQGDFFGTGLLPPKGYGAVLVNHRWLKGG
jgi:lipopolysaccharide transport system ATP-binding protein